MERRGHHTAEHGRTATIVHGFSKSPYFRIAATPRKAQENCIKGCETYIALNSHGKMHLQVQREVELLEQTGSSTVVVVGSGPAGVELATTVADRLGKRANIQLISTGKTAVSSQEMIMA